MDLIPHTATALGFLNLIIGFLGAVVLFLWVIVWLVGRVLHKCQTLYRIGWILAHWHRVQSLLKEHCKDPIEGWRVAEIRDKHPPKGAGK